MKNFFSDRQEDDPLTHIVPYVMKKVGGKVELLKQNTDRSLENY